MSTTDTSVAALHANAAGQQGIYAGAMAGLELAAGGGVIDPETNLPLVTLLHLNCTRRLVDISVQMREMWRQEMEELLSTTRDGADGGGDLLMSRAVRGTFDQSAFADAMSTQPRNSFARATQPTPFVAHGDAEPPAHFLRQLLFHHQ